MKLRISVLCGLVVGGWVLSAIFLLSKNAELTRLGPLAKTSEWILSMDQTIGVSNETVVGFNKSDMDKEDYWDGLHHEIAGDSIVFGVSEAARILYVRSRWSHYLALELVLAFLLMIFGTWVVSSSRRCKAWWKYAFYSLSLFYIVSSLYVFPNMFQKPYTSALDYVGKLLQDLPQELEQTGCDRLMM